MNEEENSIPFEPIDDRSKAILVRAKTRSEKPDQKDVKETPKKYYFIAASKGVRVRKMVVLELLKTLKMPKIKAILKISKVLLKKQCIIGKITGVNVFFGKVLCKQATITLQLDPADGFDKAPCNPIIMKDFLNKNGDITYTKVSFELAADKEED